VPLRRAFGCKKDSLCWAECRLRNHSPTAMEYPSQYIYQKRCLRLLQRCWICHLVRSSFVHSNAFFESDHPEAVSTVHIRSFEMHHDDVKQNVWLGVQSLDRTMPSVWQVGRGSVEVEAATEAPRLVPLQNAERLHADSEHELCLGDTTWSRSFLVALLTAGRSDSRPPPHLTRVT
jgi:hypothetical protein